MAHVRHRQGLRLARRPGRDRIHVPASRSRGARTRALRRAVFADQGRQDLSAAVRRPHAQLRRGAGAARLRRRRPHRPRHPAHALSAVPEVLGRVLRRVFRHRPDPGRRRRLPRRRRLEPGRRLDPPLPGPHHGARHRRLRARLLLVHVGAHLHRRRQRHGGAHRRAAAGSRIRPVPSDRHLRLRLPDHRGRPRRGRLPDQLRRRAVHGALCADRQGSRLARRGQPLDDRRDPRRARRRRASTITSCCTSNTSVPTSCSRGCPASPKRRRSFPASTPPGSRSRCCRRCTTTWAACRPIITARRCARPTTSRTRSAPG